MTKTIVTFLTLFACNLYAQDPPQYYLDENGRRCSEDEAFYYRTQERTANGLLLVRDYYVSNNQVAMEGTFTELYPSKKGEGKCSYYFENGQLKEEGEYKQGKRRGLWREYYSNAQIAEEVLCLEDKTLYYQHWDSLGNAQLTNGTGKFTTAYKTGIYYHEVLDSILIASFAIDETTGDSIHYVAQERADYKGGLEAMYSQVGRAIVYPRKARRMGIEGKVYIEFVVDKNGKLRDVKMLKGIGGGCDEEAINAFKSMNDWSPARVKGKAVMQKMVLPIAFKLTG